MLCYIPCSRSIFLLCVMRKHSKNTYTMFKLIQSTEEDNQRWQKNQNPKLSPRQHVTASSGIHTLWHMWHEGVNIDIQKCQQPIFQCNYANVDITVISQKQVERTELSVFNQCSEKKSIDIATTMLKTNQDYRRCKMQNFLQQGVREDRQCTIFVMVTHSFGIGLFLNLFYSSP